MIWRFPESWDTPWSLDGWDFPMENPDPMTGWWLGVPTWQRETSILTVVNLILLHNITIMTYYEYDDHHIYDVYPMVYPYNFVYRGRSHLASAKSRLCNRPSCPGVRCGRRRAARCEVEVPSISWRSKEAHWVGYPVAKRTKKNHPNITSWHV